MIDLEDRILIAVPKKGRLLEPTMKYLSKIGISFHKRDRFDIAFCAVNPIALIFLPASDIPYYVSQGKVSMGITGQDMVLEHCPHVQIIMELGYGKCRLAIAAPKKDSLTPTSLSGKTIATSFPNLTKQYLVETLQVKDFIIKEISGSVEIAPTLGTADAVVDLVETGSTLKEAGMEIIDTIIQTQAVLISRKNLSAKEQEWLSRIQTRLEGILTAEKYLIVDYNIAKAKLKDAQQITPGMKSPTITALDQDGWVAVRSVILKNELYPVIEKLKSIGGQAILVSSMEYFQI